MTRPECNVDELELVALLDGELTENRARELRGHLDGCASCSARRAALETLGTRLRSAPPEAADAGFVDAVDRRLTNVRQQTPRPRRATLTLGMSALAAVAAVALFVQLDRDALSPEYTARGSAGSKRPWHDLVAVTLSLVEERAGGARPAARPLVGGARMRPGEGIAVQARNASPDTPVYLMVYAVDAGKEIHWITPLWLDATADPAAVKVPPGDAPVSPGGAIPERPAPGRLEVFTLLTREPPTVRKVEAWVKKGQPPAPADGWRASSVIIEAAQN